ncbi:response regulator [Paludisphaera rhizosphaerae]|uniref:response regulator n=1 Tax=Paludisphaera rhizosphaerae TaxID=2711216 RepID=UPI0013EA2931|nr:response regulator [Paludisphaera rhizosphaerae]
MMDTTSPTAIGFAGDLTDPWVEGIAQALSGLAVVPCEQYGAELPCRAFQAVGGSRGILILHRSRLSAADVSQLEELRRGLGVENWPRIVLCVSPYVRYAEIERCAGLVEIVTPEATAAETLPRQIERMLKTPGVASRTAREASPVEVVSTDYELRQVLCEACTRAGYRASDSAELLADPVDGRRLTVWDVPVLEPRWEERLERRSKQGPVLALLGFADRTAVTHAREAGASACLDLPCAMDDLIDAVDRMAREETLRPRAQTAHATPPPPSRSYRGRLAIAERHAAAE